MHARFDPNRLGELQDAAGLSNTQLAALLDVSEGAVRRWRAGIVQPQFAHGVALAEAFGVEPSSLLTTPKPATREA